MVRCETHQTLAQRKYRLQLVSMTSFPATKVMRVSFNYEIGHLYLIGTWLGGDQKTNTIEDFCLQEIGPRLQVYEVLHTP